MRGGIPAEVTARGGRGAAFWQGVRPWIRLVGSTLAISAAVIALLLFFFQDRLIWHPAPYPLGQVRSFPRPLVPLAFRTAQGSQTAFYAPPRDHRPFPAALWVLFAGNGSLALDWADVTASDPDPGRAYLFVDYPGYGLCEGKPFPASIAQNVEGAMLMLARRLGRPDAANLSDTLARGGVLGVMGHSMGAGATLDFAARFPAASRVVLLSPFTSLRAMARRAFGWPLCWLLWGNFDNLGRLDELARRAVRPHVLVLHGDQDTLIPPEMGRALAAAHPDFIRFESVAGAGHDDIVALSHARLVAAMNGP